MKILVCISQVPDTSAKITFKNNNKILDTNGITFIINPYDEWYALVKALELREQEGGTVSVIHVGPSTNETMIRKALAIGADDAIRINKAAEDAMDVATQIAAVSRAENYDLIITGKETIEFNSSEVGSMLAGMLDLPFISYATSLEINSGVAVLRRDAGGQEEEVKLNLPFVVSASKGLAEQRIPSMRGIMMSKSKPLIVKEPVSYQSEIEVLEYSIPDLRSTCQMIDPEDMDGLVQLLHEEAKVI